AAPRSGTAGPAPDHKKRAGRTIRIPAGAPPSPATSNAWLQPPCCWEREDKGLFHLSPLVAQASHLCLCPHRQDACATKLPSPRGSQQELQLPCCGTAWFSLRVSGQWHRQRRPPGPTPCSMSCPRTSARSRADRCSNIPSVSPTTLALPSISPVSASPVA